MKKALDAHKAEIAELNGGEEPTKMDVDEEAGEKESKKDKKKKRKSLAADETVRPLSLQFVISTFSDSLDVVRFRRLKRPPRRSRRRRRRKRLKKHRRHPSTRPRRND